MEITIFLPASQLTDEDGYFNDVIKHLELEEKFSTVSKAKGQFLVSFVHWFLFKRPTDYKWSWTQHWN